MQHSREVTRQLYGLELSFRFWPFSEVGSARKRKVECGVSRLWLRCRPRCPPLPRRHASLVWGAELGDNRRMRHDQIRFDAPSSVEGWSAIDDRVMGGISASGFRYDAAGHAAFEGTVSLDSGGGFASVRSSPMDFSVRGATVYVLEVRGDGKHYKLGLRTDHDFDGVNYQASFVPLAGVWAEIRLPIADFRPTFRGRIVPGASPLDPASVRHIGFVIADKQAGSFSLAVRSIRAE